MIPSRGYTMVFIVPWLILIGVISSIDGQADTEMLYPVLMPNVKPFMKNTYLCTAFKMKRDNEYIVAFEANASMSTVHHILLYGCMAPGKRERDTPRLVWDCGEMDTNMNTGYPRGPVCASGSQILYAWARDAPALKLPTGVGFKVGQGTNVLYITLQVHYGHVDSFHADQSISFSGDATDESGIILTFLPGFTKKVTKNAGVYLLGTGGVIPPNSIEHMEAACSMDEDIELHPFAFRTHTHTLGKVVSGYVIDQDGNWNLIGKHDPMEPQMFYPVANEDLVVKQGDILAARCTMKSDREEKTRVGATDKDEMCNFYMMYWAEGDQQLQNRICFTVGPPRYYWSWDDEKIDSVPPNIDDSASKLD